MEDKDQMTENLILPRDIYRGKLVRIKASIKEATFPWYPQGIPDDAEAFGLSYTACEDITARQAYLIGKCGLLSISDSKGALWIRIPLAEVPLLMNSDDGYRNLAAGGKAMPFGPKWVGSVSFYDYPGDPENKIEGVSWAEFPGKTRIRVDVIGKELEKR